MFNVGVAFEKLEEGQTAPPGWNKVSGHLIWYVKMDFTRKARWVLDGHKTPDPIGSTFTGVVSRESAQIAFTYASLTSVCGRYTQRIATGTIFSEGLCCVWAPIRDQKRWESGAGTSSIIRRQKCRSGFQEPSQVLYASSGFPILPCRPRCLDATSEKGGWFSLL